MKARGEKLVKGGQWERVRMRQRWKRRGKKRGEDYQFRRKDRVEAKEGMEDGNARGKEGRECEGRKRKEIKERKKVEKALEVCKDCDCD